MANTEMDTILENMNTTLSDLSTSFAKNKKKTDVVLMYLIEKIDKLEEENKSHVNDISALREEISSINEVIVSLKKSNSEDYDRIDKIDKNVTKGMNNMKTQLSSMQSSIDDIRSHTLNGDSFIVIDKNDPQLAKWNRVKKFFYMLFNYKKVKQVEKEKEAAAEKERIRREQEVMENERRREKIEEEKKKEKMDEIRNILNSANKNKNKNSNKS